MWNQLSFSHKSSFNMSRSLRWNNSRNSFLKLFCKNFWWELNFYIWRRDWTLVIYRSLIEFSLFLIHYSPMSHFYTPWKRQKTHGFLTFSRGIEIDIWLKWVNRSSIKHIFLKRTSVTLGIVSKLASNIRLIPAN